MKWSCLSRYIFLDCNEIFVTQTLRSLPFFLLQRVAYRKQVNMVFLRRKLWLLSSQNPSSIESWWNWMDLHILILRIREVIRLNWLIFLLNKNILGIHRKKSLRVVILNRFITSIKKRVIGLKISSNGMILLP